MGGTGGNIAYNREEFEKLIEWALAMSPVGQVLIERSLIGWKEYELEVMRDLKDNVVIVCPIEKTLIRWECIPETALRSRRP